MFPFVSQGIRCKLLLPCLAYLRPSCFRCRVRRKVPLWWGCQDDPLAGISGRWLAPFVAMRLVLETGRPTLPSQPALRLPRVRLCAVRSPCLLPSPFLPMFLVLEVPIAVAKNKAHFKGWPKTSQAQPQPFLPRGGGPDRPGRTHEGPGPKKKLRITHLW